ncbi:MAG: nucleoside phosphorylase [Acidimicrobiia bacterium]|nr:nucleoside phosphorylase [Acidimicrobiia bacterium]
MTFPRYAGKHGHEEFLSPSAVLEWRRERRLLPDRVPHRMILLYQDRLWEAARAAGTSPIGGRGPYGHVVTIDRTAGQVGVLGGFGIGAPAAATILEEFIAVGVLEFLSIGTAGGLQPDLAPGEVIVCTGAVRDEGVSHHYAPHDVPASPDPSLTDSLEKAIVAAGLPSRRGESWTIDTPYRETAAEARHYQSGGVMCVEMEAAALFTVAAYRGVRMAAAFCVSDSLADAEWNPHFDHPDVTHNLLALFGAAVETAI